jgi:DNA polymerase bacteriophage-type
MTQYLVMDYETRSKADLKRVGQIEYARHASTQIMCVAWRLGTREELRAQLEAKTPAPCWSPFIASPYGEFKRAMKDKTVIKVAQNAGFEQAISAHVLPRLVKGIPVNPPENWICTASLAAALALPRKLEGACRVLGLRVQKDMEGHKLTLKYAKPRKPTKNNSAVWHSKLSDLKRIMQYCATDVDAETELFLRAPELNEFERRVWVLDQKINQRGFAIDNELVECALKLIAEETQALDQETFRLTGGSVRSTRQRDAVLKFVRAQGVELEDARAKTVLDTLGLANLDPQAKRLLEIRQSLSKASTAKYVAFQLRKGPDLRVRDNLVYHAASTGRWGGAGVQPQNFPRPTMKVTADVIAAVKSGDLEWLRLLYGSPMNVLSNCLRSVIIASVGKELFCGDYNAIEARMLFWFAKHEAGMLAFREGRDLYREMAAYIYGKTVEEILKDSIERFVGKGVILGCGYNMGWEKFQSSTQAQTGILLSDEAAQRAVKAYRTKHAPVVQLWDNIERAAVCATENPGKRYTINYTSWWVKDKFLWCQLPSGRRLAYYGPCIRPKKTPWGKIVPQLHHWGVDPRTRQWVLGSTYGGKLVENVVQGASRDLMAGAMLNLEDAGYEVILSVHDEALGERNKGEGTVEEFLALKTNLPVWAKGAPVKAEGWSGERYRK